MNGRKIFVVDLDILNTLFNIKLISMKKSLIRERVDC